MLTLNDGCPNPSPENMPPRERDCDRLWLPGRPQNPFSTPGESPRLLLMMLLLGYGKSQRSLPRAPSALASWACSGRFCILSRARFCSAGILGN